MNWALAIYLAEEESKKRSKMTFLFVGTKTSFDDDLLVTIHKIIIESFHLEM